MKSEGLQTMALDILSSDEKLTTGRRGIFDRPDRDERFIRPPVTIS